MRRRRWWSVAVALLVAAGLIGVGQSAAQAGGCTLTYCSAIANDLPASNYLKIARAWCGDAETLSKDDIPCAGYAGEDQTSWFEHWGARTAENEDWDAFRVEPGCVVVYEQYNQITGSDSNITVDRRSRGTQWIRVHNWQIDRIFKRTC
jgi:hypothetical protein